MPVLLVTYDLNKEQGRKPDYEGIRSVLDAYDWAKLSESSYAVATREDPTTLYSKLKPHLDDNDEIVVITLSRPWYGWHSQEVIRWLDERL